MNPGGHIPVSITAAAIAGEYLAQLVAAWEDQPMRNNGEDGGQGGEIEVILHEYDSLRAEIVSRTDSRFQLIGFLGLAATLLGITGLSASARVILIVAALIVFIGIWVYFGLYIKRCAERLREIEDEVNGKLGRPVLVWESKRLPRGRFPYNMIR